MCIRDSLCSQRSTLLSQPTIECTVYGKITNSAYQEVTQYIHEHKDEPISCMIKKLPQQFPFLDNISVHRLPNKKLTYVAHLQNPIYLFNNTHVMTETGSLVPSTTFDNSLLTHIPHFQVTDHAWLQQNQQSFFAMCNALDQKTKSHYHITFNNPYDVWLQPKDTATYSLRFCFDQTINESIHTYALTALSDFTQSKKNKGAIIVIDARFDNQMVLYTQQKGRGRC